jgi:hypothetical protein
VLDFLTTPDAPPPELIAELGFSIETLTDLREWVHSLLDWQVENFTHLLYGGTVNPDQAKYVVGPVAKLMAELEGPKLGGFLSEIILLWVSGEPFRSIWHSKKDYWHTVRIEDLISVVYSRVQYLLPWGLYAADRLVRSEAQRRSIAYENQLRSLAYLADAGVPSFDALRLVSLDFERVDATRLAIQYQKSGGLNTGIDIVEWVITQPLRTLISCVRGQDNRRIDFDLEKRVEALRVK